MLEIDTFKAQQVYQEADCLYDMTALSSAIKNTATRITQDLSETNPLVISIMNGGLVYCGQLLTHLDFPLELDYLHATRYMNETRGGELNWLARPASDLTGRVVLLVDDILDEGHTLVQVQEYCRQQGAKKVFTTVLLDKDHNRKAQQNLVADYTCLKVEDRFVFGFGMDYQGYWRNAPGIFAVKGL
jgi:hypoxanthine phosphoribosyltransferase